MFVYFHLICHVFPCSLFELFSGSNMFTLFTRSFRVPLCLSQVVRCVFMAILYCCFLHFLCFLFLKYLYLSALHYRLRACSLTFVNLLLDRIIFLACNPSYRCYIKLCFFLFFFLPFYFCSAFSSFSCCASLFAPFYFIHIFTTPLHRQSCWGYVILPVVFNFVCFSCLDFLIMQAVFSYCLEFILGCLIAFRAWFLLYT